ncbi:MAG: hypothetical protein V1913_11220 [Fibrobacterota bacterium]
MLMAALLPAAVDPPVDLTLWNIPAENGVKWVLGDSLVTASGLRTDQAFAWATRPLSASVRAGVGAGYGRWFDTDGAIRETAGRIAGRLQKNWGAQALAQISARYATDRSVGGDLVLTRMGTRWSGSADLSGTTRDNESPELFRDTTASAGSGLSLTLALTPRAYLINRVAVKRFWLPDRGPIGTRVTDEHALAFYLLGGPGAATGPWFEDPDALLPYRFNRSLIVEAGNRCEWFQTQAVALQTATLIFSLPLSGRLVLWGSASTGTELFAEEEAASALNGDASMFIFFSVRNAVKLGGGAQTQSGFGFTGRKRFFHASFHHNL